MGINHKPAANTSTDKQAHKILLFILRYLLALGLSGQSVDIVIRRDDRCLLCH